MENTYTNAVITTEGKRLREDASYEGKGFTFTRFVLGNGVYTGAEASISNLETLSELKSEKNEYTISNIERPDTDKVKLTFLVTNYDPETGESIVPVTYRANEIGLFALQDGEEEEILYSICVCPENGGDAIGAYNGYNPLQVVETYNEKVGNSEIVSIRVDGAYALAEDLEAEEAARIEADFLNLYGLCTKTTTIAIVSGNKQITESGDGVTAVTTIVKTSDTQKNITTVITPTEGDYFYTKTTVITKTSGGKTITESYTRSLKPQQVSE